MKHAINAILGVIIYREHTSALHYMRTVYKMSEAKYTVLDMVSYYDTNMT